MASTPFVPAWKRLGLKLKGSPASTPIESPAPASEIPSRTKRKIDTVTDHDQNSTPSLKRKKSVSFTTEATTPSKPVTQQTPAPTKSFTPLITPQPEAPQTSSTPSSKPTTKDRKPRKKEIQAKTEETERYISYLQQFHSAREEWHFNKGRQTALLKNIFNVFRVPEEHDDALVAYLTGLQGQAARDRLTETANEILKSTKDTVESDDTMSESTHIEARDAALKKHLKDAKGRLRDSAAKEDSTSDDRLLLLRKRARADVILKGLGAGQPGMASKLATPPEDEEPAAKKKKTRRSKKARTGVPDDDLSDDTSSVSSVPSSAGSDDESSSEEESDSSSSEDSSSDEEGSDDE
ncbi:hypothetical protein BLS_007608 [Venturia inaequalis]|uniref:WKF domain-containing protein n=1 Tax=Venturia inaequalis TaxID=5025 RepID=A0A8H3UB66_VENIN|nr:hypothetical protein BLS_007608 [Venturia inaequalis]KAE9988788.1 hypothetical protein EG328_007392 [Venturia inaequalis]KAE9993400.1 hypothetical protein EG327_005171 [Venturia inaequalis]